MGMSLIKCGLWNIYHAEYGPFLATDWLKIKGSVRIMGLKNFLLTVKAVTLIFIFERCSAISSAREIRFYF